MTTKNSMMMTMIVFNKQ